MNGIEELRKCIEETDLQLARLFERRMRAAGEIGAYKEAAGLPVYDPQQEERVIRRGLAAVENSELKPYFRDLLIRLMNLSRQYQSVGIGSRDRLTEIPVRTSAGFYDVLLERGCLSHAGEYLDLNRKVLIVTDTGIPKEYSDRLAAFCREPVTEVLAAGESSKNMFSFEHLQRSLLSHGFTRGDCVVSLGGGMCGDLAGFAAATYMRGIDFYNIPTTVLSMVDSSVGGKTAVDFDGIKNVIGAFYPPKRVLIDPDLTLTLSARECAAGLAEALKMAVTLDPELFRLFEEHASRRTGEQSLSVSDPEFLSAVIGMALRIKASVVSEDEFDTGLRHVLNFGHTIGHGIESAAGGALLHGECVAIGMLPMCAPPLRARLLPVYRMLGLPTSVCGRPAEAAESLTGAGTLPAACFVTLNDVCAAMLHDKKAAGAGHSASGKSQCARCGSSEDCRQDTQGSGAAEEWLIIEADAVGKYRLRPAGMAELREKAAMMLKGVLE